MSQSVVATPSRAERLSAELVLYVGRLNRAVTRAAMGASDVPTASLRLLAQVEEIEPATVGALAAADRCSQPTMSAGVASLVERGWAAKRPHPDDARSSLVSLTEAGRTVLRGARQRRAEVVAARLRSDHRHDEDDLAAAVDVLRGLLAHTDTAPAHPTEDRTEDRTEDPTEDPREEGTS